MQKLAFMTAKVGIPDLLLVILGTSLEMLAS
jgi:hypothetical protein